MTVIGLRQELLYAGDWNEREANQGRYSPAWIADQLGVETFTPGPRAIDWGMASCPVYGCEIVGKGGSDHQMVIFTVRYPHSARVLRGAIWNCERDRDPKAVASFLREQMLDHRLDFVLLQEAKQYHQILRDLEDVVVVAFNRPAGAEHSVIVVRTGVDINSTESRKMSRAGWVLRGWGGHKLHAPSYTTFATLDGWLHVGSVHEPPAVDWRRSGPGRVWRAIGALDRVRARRQSARRYIAHGRRVFHLNRKESR